MRKWRRRAILTAQKEVVTFRWYRQRPLGLGVLCSDGCNQCSDAKGWVLDAGEHRGFFVCLRTRLRKIGTRSCRALKNELLKEAVLQQNKRRVACLLAS